MSLLSRVLQLRASAPTILPNGTDLKNGPRNSPPLPPTGNSNASVAGCRVPTHLIDATAF